MSLTSCSCGHQSEEQKVNQQINKQLKQDQRYLNSKIKLLLLGKKLLKQLYDKQVLVNREKALSLNK